MRTRRTPIVVIAALASIVCGGAQAGQPEQRVEGAQAPSHVEIESGYAEVPGGRLFYEVAGSGDTLVLIHGNIGDRRHWDHQFEALAQKLRVVRYDVRGFGRSSLPEEDKPYTNHEDLAALLDHLDISRAHIAGWSMGSGIAVDFVSALGGEADGTTPVGPYLGQEGPGLTPQVFAPGIVSTSANELNCAFSPDGKELVFTERRQGRNTLMIMKQWDGRWTERSVVPFSGEHGDVDPYFTSDGTRLYFSSSRPLERGGEAKDADLWFVERGEDGEWGRPVQLEGLSAPGKDDYYTSMTLDGVLYFSRFETHGDPGDIYRSRLSAGRFAPPELVTGSVSTEFNEHDPFVAPDGSYLIFSSDRPGGHGRGDLYVTFRRPDGAWGEPRNMGEPINSEGYEYCPMLSPDGKYLFFTRNPGGNGDVYWVAADVVKKLRERARQPQQPSF